MNLEIRKVLFDIQEAGAAIKGFVAGKTLADFQQSDLLRSAVERKFEIIGEALHRMRRLDEELIEQITDYRRIVGFRNILAHGYDVVSPEIIWEICGENLEQLLTDVDRLMNA